jgi:hypothetical protein
MDHLFSEAKKLIRFLTHIAAKLPIFINFWLIFRVHISEILTGKGFVFSI